MANEHDSPTADTDQEEAAVADETELPADVIEEAETLTRRTRRAVDENEATAYREARDELLAKHDFTARIRDEERAVLVLYPEEWVEDGTVRPELIEDIDRGIERPLEGAGDPDDWETVGEHNDAIAETIADEHGGVHGANARELATFLSNHYAKPIEDATDDELTEFLTDYYKRNVWPSDDQKAVVEESVRLTVERARRVTGRER
jgi:hypothetical protein